MLEILGKELYEPDLIKYTSAGEAEEAKRTVLLAYKIDHLDEKGQKELVKELEDTKAVA